MARLISKLVATRNASALILARAASYARASAVILIRYSNLYHNYRMIITVKTSCPRWTTKGKGISILIRVGVKVRGETADR